MPNRRCRAECCDKDQRYANEKAMRALIVLGFGTFGFGLFAAVAAAALGL
jgi:hypothetical protein